MKYFNQIFCFVIGVLVYTVLISCVTTWTAPNYTRASKELPRNVSNYCDYRIKDCTLPDGKIADVYIFNHSADAVAWQNCQTRIFRKDNFFTKLAPSPQDLWKPIGPLTPYFEKIYYFQNRYGEKMATEMLKEGISALSYYTTNDLGEVGRYMSSLDSVAQAFFQDSTGVYLLSIGSPKNFIYDLSKEEQKQHEGQFAYKISFIPKTTYEKILPVKLQPAKTQPYNPTAIPDSERNLTPVLPINNSSYYYDETLAYQLQWLAVKVACKGVYDTAYTGDFSTTNPADWYTTSLIKNYLAKNDGNASKGTLLFEGICFDYADFAYQEIANNKSVYQNIANFWMVGTFNDFNDIIVYRIAKDGETSNQIINRTPVIVFSHSHTRAHNYAINHAWVWVQTTDGTVYWVDPTWTDNSGRPVYGIVRGGQEIQLTPAQNLCIK